MSVFIGAAQRQLRFVLKEMCRGDQRGVDRFDLFGFCDGGRRALGRSRSRGRDGFGLHPLFELVHQRLRGRSFLPGALLFTLGACFRNCFGRFDGGRRRNRCGRGLRGFFMSEVLISFL